MRENRTLIPLIKKSIKNLVIFIPAFFLPLIPIISECPSYIILFTVANIYVVFTASFDILSGYTGYVNMGHTFLIAVGGYSAALLDIYHHVPPLLSILAGGMVSAVTGLSLALPSLRLKGPYFAILSFVYPLIFEKITKIFYPIFRGDDGLAGVTSLTESIVTNYYFTLFFALISTFLITMCANSYIGTIFRAIREDETACEAAGVNVTLYKFAAFTISAFFAGTAGAIYGHVFTLVSLDLASLSLLVTLLTTWVVGGIGTLLGPTAAAYVMYMLDEQLRRIMPEMRTSMFSMLLIFLILLEPRGIFHRIFSFFKNTSKRWLFWKKEYLKLKI